MPSRRTASGFTLLELMVVLAIMGALLGLVTPNLTFDRENDRLQRDAQQLRHALQQVIDESWLSGQSKVLRLEHNDLQLLSVQEDEWTLEKVVFHFDDSLEQHIDVSMTQLEAARSALKADDADWLVLSSGEYLSFEWHLTWGEKSVMLTGDGINAVSLN